MLVGVVADTHIPGRARALPRALLEGLAGVDHILHAGDITAPAVLRQLEQLAPVTAVAGNNDPPGLQASLGLYRLLNWQDGQVGLLHGHVGPGRTALERARLAFAGRQMDCVVFGHSHQSYLAVEDGVLLLNPGSPTDRRRAQAYSYALLHLGPDGVQAELRCFTDRT